MYHGHIHMQTHSCTNLYRWMEAIKAMEALASFSRRKIRNWETIHAPKAGTAKGASVDDLWFTQLFVRLDSFVCVIWLICVSSGCGAVCLFVCLCVSVSMCPSVRVSCDCVVCVIVSACLLWHSTVSQSVSVCLSVKATEVSARKCTVGSVKIGF